MPSYIALVRKDPDSDYGINFPDFPRCVTAAQEMDQVRMLAEEALRFHIEGILEDGEPLPNPSTSEKVMSDPENCQAAALLVNVSEDTWRKST